MKNRYGHYSIETLQTFLDFCVRRPKNHFNDHEITEIRQALKNKRIAAMSFVFRIDQIERHLAESLMHRRKKDS